MNIEEIKKYVESVNLNDWELGGVEITEEDLYEVKKLVEAGKTLEDAVDTYLKKVREILDEGLEDEEE